MAQACERSVKREHRLGEHPRATLHGRNWFPLLHTLAFTGRKVAKSIRCCAGSTNLAMRAKAEQRQKLPRVNGKVYNPEPSL